MCAVYMVSHRLLGGFQTILAPISAAVLNQAVGSTADELTLWSFARLYPNLAVKVAAVSLVSMVLFVAVVLYLRARVNRRIDQLLYVDELTGVWNLRKFQQEAQKLLSNNRFGKYVLLCTDVDNFKACNATYGYAASDQILQTISQVVQRNLRPGEAFARSNADQFVALLRIADQSQLLPRLAELNQTINDILQTQKNLSRIALITGVCFPAPGEWEVSRLLDRANVARKSVKGSRHSTCAVYDEAMRRSRQFRRDMERTMEQALQNGDFVAYYQPKYQIETRKIVGAEALARWMHPEKGMISPGEFIPLFEQNGFVVELDFFIFEEVCKLLRSWLDAGLPVVPISTNFSRVDLAQKDFCSRLKAVASRHRVPPYLLELELTESAVEQSSDQLVVLSEQLKAMGFLLSMDDFGSGYSSLNMLKKLPVDTLKLDKNFLREGLADEKARILIEGFVEMAHRMHMLVVCEGVEWEEQAQFLSAIGCQTAQGYLYAHPMPAAEFARVLHESQVPEMPELPEQYAFL